MNSRLRIGIIIILILVIFLSFGCMKLDVQLKVHSDGTADTVMTMDMSAMAALMSGMGDVNGEDPAETYSKNNICEIMQEGQISTDSLFGSMENAECRGIDDYIAEYTMKGTNLVEEGSLIIEETNSGNKYTLTMKNDENSESEMNPEQINAMKAMGLEMNLEIEMPGTIVSATAGEINGNTVNIDLVENIGSLDEGLVIVSEESTLALDPMLLGIGAVVLLIIIVGAVIVIKKKKGKSKPGPMRPFQSPPQTPTQPPVQTPPQEPPQMPPQSGPY